MSRLRNFLQAAPGVLGAQVHLAVRQHQEQRRLRRHGAALAFHPIEQLRHQRCMDPPLGGFDALSHYGEISTKRGWQLRPGHLVKHREPAHFLRQTAVDGGLKRVGDDTIGVTLQRFLERSVENHHGGVRVSVYVRAPAQFVATHIVARRRCTFQPPRMSSQSATQIKMPFSGMRNNAEPLRCGPAHHLLVGDRCFLLGITHRSEGFAQTIKHTVSKRAASQ